MLKNFVLLGSLIALLLSGCLDTEPSWTESSPGPGAWADYATAEGTTLNITYLGQGVIRDAWGNRVDVDHWRFQVKPADTTAGGFNVTEHIDIHTGLIVRHDTDCRVTGYGDGACDRTHHMATFTPHGLPGLLGMGPAWYGGDTPEALSAGGFQISSPPLGEWQEAQGAPDCIERIAAHRDTADPWKPFGAWLPTTAVASPLLRCPGATFPAAFEPDMYWPRDFPAKEDIRFRLISDDRGEGDLDRAAEESGILPLPSWKPEPERPLAPLGDERPFLRYSSEQAHNFLLENDPGYNEMMSNGGSIVHTSHALRKTVTKFMNTTTSEVDQWRFLVRAADGTFSRHAAEWEIIYGPTGSEVNRSASVVEEDHEEIGLSPPPFMESTVSLRGTLAWAASLWGCQERNFSDVHYRLDEGRRDGRWSGISNGRQLFKVDMDPPNHDGGIWSPWYLQVDGLTGGVLEISASPEIIERYDDQGVTTLTTCPD